jgi:hypothetical protein
MRKKLEGAVVTKKKTGDHILPGKALRFYTCSFCSNLLICMVEQDLGYAKGQVLTNMDGFK